MIRFFTQQYLLKIAEKFNVFKLHESYLIKII
jgi:hypothetical protein